MIYRNRADIIGTLGADPEINYTQSGTAVAKMRVATTLHYKDQEGVLREVTDWHTVECWGKTAENASAYLRKGDQVAVEGRNKTERFTGSDGIERFATKIVAESVQYGSKGPASREERGSHSQQAPRAHQQQQSQRPAPRQASSRPSYPSPTRQRAPSQNEYASDDGHLPPSSVRF